MRKIKLLIVVFIFSIPLFANSISSNKIAQWQKIGVPKDYIYDWKSEGLTYEEAKKWTDIGIGRGNKYGYRDILEWKHRKITPEEAKGWKDIGISTKQIRQISYWKEIGINDPKEAKKWTKLKISIRRVPTFIKNGITADMLKSWYDVGIFGKHMLMYKKYKINTPEEAKKWKDTGINFEWDLENLKEANVNTPEEAKKWRDAGIDFSDIKTWKELGINNPEEAKKWKDEMDIAYVSQWIQVGISNLKEVKEWKNIGVSAGWIKSIKKVNLTKDKITKWRKAGITKIKTILLLVNGGFKDYNQFKPYQGMYISHAIKLKQWNIKPNKLIKSMSQNSQIIDQELFFNNQNIFKKAYDSIKGNCNEIVGNKWFGRIDISENKDICYTFMGVMVQRLDEKSFFGKVTKSGLIQGMGRKYFYAEKFKNNWIKDKGKIGVIKGNGSFSYHSASGKELIPKGTVIFYK